MDPLIRKRAGFKAALTKAESTVASLNTTNANVIQLDLRIAKLDELCANYSQVQDEIEELSEDSDIETHQKDRVDFDEKVITIKTSMLTLRAQLPAVTVPQVPQPNVKLRPLDLPHFNGKISEWRSYRDRFISAIHNQVGMSKVDKLRICVRP